MSVDLKINTKSGIDDLDKLLLKLKQVEDRLEKLSKGVASKGRTKKSKDDSIVPGASDSEITAKGKKAEKALKKTQNKQTDIIKSGVESRIDAIEKEIEAEALSTSMSQKQQKKRNTFRAWSDRIDRSYLTQRLNSQKKYRDDQKRIDERAFSDELKATDTRNKALAKQLTDYEGELSDAIKAAQEDRKKAQEKARRDREKAQEKERRDGVKAQEKAQRDGERQQLSEAKRAETLSKKIFNARQYDISEAASRLNSLRSTPLFHDRFQTLISGTPAQKKAIADLDFEIKRREGALAFARESAKRTGMAGFDFAQSTPVSKDVTKEVTKNFENFNRTVQQSGGRVNRVAHAFSSLGSSTLLVSRGISSAAQGIKSFVSTGARIGALTLGVATLATGLHTIRNELDRLLEISTLLDRSKNIFTFSLGSDKAAIREMEYLVDLSKRYNLNIESMLKSSSKFYASAAQIGLPLQDIRSVFEGIAQAQAVFRLSGEETEGVMYALSQMASKGKVSMEELRLQLAERLPGSLALAAKAMGVTQGQLDKLVSSGQLLSRDFLPLFGREVQRTLGPAAAKVGAGVSGTLESIKNVPFEFRKSVFDNREKEIISVLTTFRDELKTTLQAINNLYSEDMFQLTESIIKGLSNAGNYLVDVVIAIASKLGLVKGNEPDAVRNAIQGQLLQMVATPKVDNMVSVGNRNFVVPTPRQAAAAGGPDFMELAGRQIEEARKRNLKLIFRDVEGMEGAAYEFFTVTKETAEKILKENFSTEKIRALALRQQSDPTIFRDAFNRGIEERRKTIDSEIVAIGESIRSVNLNPNVSDEYAARKSRELAKSRDALLEEKTVLDKRLAASNSIADKKIGKAAEATMTTAVEGLTEADKIVRERYRDLLRLERQKELAALTKSVLGLEGSVGGTLGGFFQKRRQLIDARVGGAIGNEDFERLQNVVFRSEILGKDDTIEFQKIVASKIFEQADAMLKSAGASIRLDTTSKEQLEKFADIKKLMSGPIFDATREDIAKTIYEALIISPIDSITDPVLLEKQLQEIKNFVGGVTGLDTAKVDFIKTGTLITTDLFKFFSDLLTHSGETLSAGAEEFLNTTTRVALLNYSKIEAETNAQIIKAAETIARGNIDTLASFLAKSLTGHSARDIKTGAETIFNEQFQKKFKEQLQNIQFDPTIVGAGFDDLRKWINDQIKEKKVTQEVGEKALIETSRKRAADIKSFLGVTTFQDEKTLLAQRLELLNQLYNHEDEKIRINAQTKAYYEFEFRKELDETFRKQIQATEAYRNAFKSMFTDMQGAFLEFVKTGEFSFSNMIDNMLARLLELQFQMRVIEPLMQGVTSGDTPSWFNSLFGGIAAGAARPSTATEAAMRTPSIAGTVTPTGNSLIGAVSSTIAPRPTAFGYDTVFGGGRVSGGDVSPGKRYMVNERPSSPEIFLPGMNGKVMPLNKLVGGSNVNIVVNNSSSANVETQQNTDDQGNINIELMVTDIVNTGIASGKFDRTLRSNFQINRKGY